jgi:2-polyprenyl-6-methoxyphenol hydroxylase-like FAD-dependent oxidoreductase
LTEWKAEVAAFWPEMAVFSDQITTMTPARYSHGTLRRPYLPGLAFIGDAAHRASPQLGQGANMALLDAMALALALREGLDGALPRYAQMRRWHLRAYQIMSAAFTPMYQSDSRILPWLRDHLLAPLGQLRPVRAVLSRLVSGTLIPPLASQVWPGQDAGQTPTAE